MAAINDVYDAFVTLLGTTFPSKTRLPRPYSLEENKYHHMKDGYALVRNGTAPLNGLLNTLEDAHGFGVIFTRESIRLESDITPQDNAIKALDADIQTLREKMKESDPLTLGSAVLKIDLEEITAPTEVLLDKNIIISMQTNFLITTIEELAC